MLIGSNGDGDFLPPFIILKVSTADDFDLSNEKTLDKLMRENEWQETWEKKYFKKAFHEGSEKKVYVRPYLINKENLSVITTQKNAWNDTIGFLMHVEIQLARISENNLSTEKSLYVIDNVGFHHSPVILEAFKKVGFIVAFFPPNMTNELQPMDLVVNSVFKSEIRNLRVTLVYESLQFFREQLKDYYTSKSLGISVENYKTKLLSF